MIGRRSMTETVSTRGTATSHRAMTGVIRRASPWLRSTRNQHNTKPRNMLPASPMKVRAVESPPPGKIENQEDRDDHRQDEQDRKVFVACAAGDPAQRGEGDQQNAAPPGRRRRRSC